MTSRLSAGERGVRILRKPLQRGKRKKLVLVHWSQIYIYKTLKIRSLNNVNKKGLDHY